MPNFIALVQDVAAAMILSEAVYKALDGSIKQAVDSVGSILAELPEGLRQPLKVQWSLPHVAHRYASVRTPFVFCCQRSDIQFSCRMAFSCTWQDMAVSLVSQERSSFQSPVGADICLSPVCLIQVK